MNTLSPADRVKLVVGFLSIALAKSALIESKFLTPVDKVEQLTVLWERRANHGREDGGRCLLYQTLQRLLSANGFATSELVADGVWGPQSTASLKQVLELARELARGKEELPA